LYFRLQFLGLSPPTSSTLLDRTILVLGQLQFSFCLLALPLPVISTSLKEIQQQLTPALVRRSINRRLHSCAPSSAKNRDQQKARNETKTAYSTNPNFPGKSGQI
jgi:hypothetical protein